MNTAPDTTPEDHVDDDDMTETTVSDPDEIEVDEPEVDAEPPDWLVIASPCYCGHIAMSIVHPDCILELAVLELTEPVHADAVAAYNPRWQSMVAPLAVTVAQPSGLPISAECTSVYLPRVEAPAPQQEEVNEEEAAEKRQAAEQLAAAQKRDAEKRITDEVHRIMHRMLLPPGVKVVGRYDFCGSKHPSRSDTWCRRGVDHDGDHNAYTDSIAVPETWSAVPVLVDLDDGDVA